MKVETEEAATKTMSTDPKDYFAESSNYRFLRTHMGYPIFVTVDEGKFVTKLPGRDEVSRSSLTDMEKEIEKQGKPVSIMVAKLQPSYLYAHAQGGASIRTLEIIEASQTTGRGYYTRAAPTWKVRTGEGRLEEFSERENVYLADAAVAAEFERILDEEATEFGQLETRAKEEGKEIGARYLERLKSLLEDLEPLTRKGVREARKA